MQFEDENNEVWQVVARLWQSFPEHAALDSICDYFHPTKVVRGVVTWLRDAATAGVANDPHYVLDDYERVLCLIANDLERIADQMDDHDVAV